MTESKEDSVYARLSNIDVSKYVEGIPRKNKKTGQIFNLDYLPWAKAWGLVKSIYPDANYEINTYPNWVKTKDGTFQQAGELDYRITSVGCEVSASVIIHGERYTQRLYPMDKFNNPIMNPNIKDINKAQLRCVVKALAIAGLGLNIYAGEDLPSSEENTPKRQEKPAKLKEKPTKDELITVAKERRAQYGGGKELVTDIVGLEMDGDRQADLFLNNWCAKNPKNKALYTFIKENNLATHGMKVGA